MKKLLCVLMFGMVFGQALIETREYEINIEDFGGNNTIINMMELIGEAEGNFYLGDVVQSDFLFYYSDPFSNSNLSLGVESMCDTMSNPMTGDFLNGNNSIFLNNVISSSDDTPTDGLLIARYKNYTHHFKFTAEKPYVIFRCSGDCGNGLPDEIHLRIHISGVFSDTDVGLQGDMNDDDSLDVMDVVMLVDIILSGGMGDVGNLLNIVTG